MNPQEMLEDMCNNYLSDTDIYEILFTSISCNMP